MLFKQKRKREKKSYHHTNRGLGKLIFVLFLCFLDLNMDLLALNGVLLISLSFLLSFLFARVLAFFFGGSYSISSVSSISLISTLRLLLLPLNRFTVCPLCTFK
eukprot:UN01756